MSVRDLDLRSLLTSWELAMRAERKSPHTIATYSAGVRGFLTWCEREGHRPKLTKPLVQAWIAGLLEAGAEPATAVSRQSGVVRFSKWLMREGEQAADPLAGLPMPKIDTKVVEPLTDDQLRAMLKACAGPTLRDRRDEALLRFMLETGTRAGEVVALEVADVDLPAGTAVVRRGKGGKGRVVPFGPQTARALDRYVRIRARQRLAATPHLWLGVTSPTLTYAGLRNTLGKRAADAGITGFHVHRLRHTAAHRWLAAGGSQDGLMTVAGWSRPDMLMRYTRAQASARAADEARRLNLGDLG